MYETELALAQDLADRAADIGLSYFRQEDLEIRRKADRTLVTAADHAIERMVRERLAETFPHDHIIGEEEGGDHEPGGRVWIVDPIDSTANFARGIQVWATLIALHVDKAGVLGIVSAPAIGERYVGVRGDGATLNGEPIRVSETDDFSHAHVLLQEQDALFAGPYREPVLQMVQDGWRTRGFGDFWAHVLVARGSAEIMLEPFLSIWDLAAPQVIVEAAGGRCSTFEGGPLFHGGSMLVTNGALHDEVLARLASAR
jgi:histidinol-phosphatase